MLNKVVFVLIISFFSVAYAVDVPIDDFSIKPYSQNPSDYVSPDTPDYKKSLISAKYQAIQYKQFYNHYFSTGPKSLSPWGEDVVKAILPWVKQTEKAGLDEFREHANNPDKQHYGENFKVHGKQWLDKIEQNMNLGALDSLSYDASKRAIVVNNTLARALPESAPDFFHFTLPGQGFPFDNLQMASLWVGTPLYVISHSKNKAWSLVFTPDAYIGWVKSSDIAYVSENFIKKWQQAAKKQLVAVTQTGASILNREAEFLFTGYIGAVFPLYRQANQTSSIFIPFKDQQGQAQLHIGVIKSGDVALMPMVASKENIIKLMQSLQNRPYGWGGAFFFNDCSQELKSLFTPFGIWLPKHSSLQAKSSSTENYSDDTLEERLNALREHGRPFMTIIFIGGHVMLYIGESEGAYHHKELMTYQNVWGLTNSHGDKRYIIGQSLFLPLLSSYPGYPDVVSLADKTYFKLTYVDDLDPKPLTPKAFVKQYYLSSPVNLSDMLGL